MKHFGITIKVTLLLSILILCAVHVNLKIQQAEVKAYTHQSTVREGYDGVSRINIRKQDNVYVQGRLLEFVTKNGYKEIYENSNVTKYEKISNLDRFVDTYRGCPLVLASFKETHNLTLPDEIVAQAENLHLTTN